MPDTETAASSKRVNVFYTKDTLREEFLRFLSTRPNNKGATEYQIRRVAQTMPWIEFREEIYADSESTKGDKAAANCLRRFTMPKCIKKLYDQGYTAKEIALGLDIKYSTAWYYCNKIRKGIKPKLTKTDIIIGIDENTPGEHFKVKRVKVDRATDYFLLAKAEAKRCRKAEKLARLAARAIPQSQESEAA